MTFPFYFKIGAYSIHPHILFEGLAYFIGFRVFLWMRKKSGDPLSNNQRLIIIAACISGGLLGSKILYWLTNPPLTLQNWRNASYLMGGKTIVGGLAGGLFMVEMVKKRMGITQSTGDLFAIPLAVGLAIGRIGCFLSGLGDETYGSPTFLPWGINFGDGIARHPVQLYEILYLSVLTLWLRYLGQHHPRRGDMFKSFMVFYLGFRFLIEFIKPGIPIMGLNAIQWTSLAVIFYYWRDLPVLLRIKKESSNV